jgi:hypothetical protein
VIIEPELSGNRLKETKMTQIAKKEMISKCGHEKIVVQMPEDWNQQERALVRTATGEPFMPARLYFKSPIQQ